MKLPSNYAPSWGLFSRGIYMLLILKPIRDCDKTKSESMATSDRLVSRTNDRWLYGERTREFLCVQAERDDGLWNLDKDKQQVCFSRSSFGDMLTCSHHFSDSEFIGTLGSGTRRLSVPSVLFSVKDRWCISHRTASFDDDRLRIAQGPQ